MARGTQHSWRWLTINIVHALCPPGAELCLTSKRKKSNEHNPMWVGRIQVASSNSWYCSPKSILVPGYVISIIPVPGNVCLVFPTYDAAKQSMGFQLDQSMDASPRNCHACHQSFFFQVGEGGGFIVTLLWPPGIIQQIEKTMFHKAKN